MKRKPTYYNEIDAYAAQWLRNLIAAGVISPGYVDERSIEDVTPYDLRDFERCHFFAGIGVWDYALGIAGWADDRPVWTGSCPCQPFSAAGQGGGFDDERHLWPSWFWLIAQCQPAELYGEQVASADGLTWLDLVQADMEGENYAFGAGDLCSAGVGSPHIRQRLYWYARRMAHAGGVGREVALLDAGGRAAQARQRQADEPGSIGAPGRMGDADHARLEGLRRGHQAARGRIGTAGPAAQAGQPLRLADAYGLRLEPLTGGGLQADAEQDTEPCSDSGLWLSDPTKGFWRGADWLACRDGKWRAVEPGTFPLANGVASRVGRLRAYGNAVNAGTTAAFIAAAMDYRP